MLLSIRAALRGGYVGPDYPTHFARLIDWSRIFDFSASNPPGYYLLGHILFVAVGPSNAFPITLSILQASVNLLALWGFFIFSERRFASPLLHLAFALFLTFLPVRVIHAVTVGTDWATVPLFLLLLFLFDTFLSERSSKNAAAFGLALGIAVFIKYSFMALLPTVLLVLVLLWRHSGWKFRRFLRISALTLTLGSAVALYSFSASARLHGYNTEKHWLQKGIPPDMGFKDLFTIKTSDIQLFRAPEYFKREILVPHKHSYLALSHMGTFSDPMNLFQELNVPQRFGSALIPDQKTRRLWKTPVMQASIALGTIWTILALIGTIWLLFCAGRHVVRNQLEREDVAIVFGTAFFLLLFLPIPFVHGGAIFGYWTPRLILPALVCFFWATFLFVDRKLALHNEKLAVAVLLLAGVQCAIELVMLT